MVHSTVVVAAVSGFEDNLVDSDAKGNIVVALPLYWFAEKLTDTVIEDSLQPSDVQTNQRKPVVGMFEDEKSVVEKTTVEVFDLEMSLVEFVMKHYVAVESDSVLYSQDSLILVHSRVLVLETIVASAAS